MTTRSILVLSVALVLSVVGGWLALESPILARSMVDGLVREQGGGMATETYLALLASSAAAYRLVGSVLLAVGLLSALQIGNAGPMRHPC